MRRVELTLIISGPEEVLREMVVALQPDFKDSEDVQVDFTLERELKVTLRGRDLSTVLSTVGTLKRLITVFRDVETVVNSGFGER
ncbi:MAG: hypothetical protein J7L88_06695 [Thermoplasmata archaeon]|nr:hypothetical protein [Thermoplasmata archaeon]